MAQPNTDQQSNLPGVVQPHVLARETIQRFSVIKEGRELLINRLPTPAERQVLMDHRARLDTMLRATSYTVTDEQKLNDMLSVLFAGYGQLMKMDKAEAAKVTAGYILHLRHLPLFALAKACDDISKNRVPSVNENHPPSAMAIGKAAEVYVVKASTERRSAIDILNSADLQRPEEKPGDRDRVMKMNAEVQARLAALSDQVDMKHQKQTAEIRAWHAQKHAERLAAEWAAIGEEPRTISGMTISVSLARLMRLIPYKPTKPDPTTIQSLGAR